MNKNTLRRYMKAIGFSKGLLENFDESTDIIQRSGNMPRSQLRVTRLKLWKS